MLTITKILEDLIGKNSFLKFGLAHKLLNLSQTASWLKSSVSARAGREVSTSAILMSLSRVTRRISKQIPTIEKVALTRINIYNNLCELTFVRSQKVEEAIGKLYHEVKKRNGYITVSQGVNEITIIVDQDAEKTVSGMIKSTLKFRKDNLAALGIQFDEKYVHNAGLLYYIVQQVTLQNINIWEMSSTFTELIFYIDEKDIELAFDTLYKQFMKKEG